MDGAARLRDEIEGDVVVYASGELGRALLERGLVDELRLVVFPVVLGSGARFVASAPDSTSLRLVDARPIGTGLVLLVYETKVA